jgi:hypothetical protein
MADVPTNIMDELNNHSTVVQENFDIHTNWNKQLVGHIDHQYVIKPKIEKLDNLVLELAKSFDNQFDILKTKHNIFSRFPTFVNSSAWINFQQATEYNPVHNHSGIMSWVIWLKIPYSREEENKVYPRRDVTLNGAFQFMYTNSMGDISTHQIMLDKTYEGKILMFPSKLNHMVYPFYTSSEYRISVAGNILLDVETDAPRFMIYD